LAIPVTDPALKLAILAHMIEKIDGGGLDELLAAGVSPAFIDDLRRRQARDVGHAARQAICRVEVIVDTAQVQQCFDRIDQTRRDEQIKEYFIRHGASSTLLRNLFKLSKSAVNELRQALGLEQETPVGRPRLPEEAVRDQIHVVWQQIRTAKPHASTREQFHQLHQRLNEHHPNVLWAAIEEFDALGA
jgi:hypothetical protein